jgi:hypothetical protein
MDEACSSKTISTIFTKASHHRNLTVLYLVQNIFNKSKNQRTISLNTHYNIVFRNPRDVSQFRILAQQMFPTNTHWLLESFEDATSKPFGYLVLDHHPRSYDEKRVLTNILPSEQLKYYSIKNRAALNEIHTDNIELTISNLNSLSTNGTILNKTSYGIKSSNKRTCTVCNVTFSNLFEFHSPQ